MNEEALVEESIPNFDSAMCKCGRTFLRTSFQSHVNLRRCRECRREYKYELEKRKRRGPITGPPCRICDRPTSVRNTSGFHAMCAWEERWRARLEAARREREEWRRPTRDETWWMVGRSRLSEARSLLRDASRSPTPASQPARTSRSS